MRHWVTHPLVSHPANPELVTGEAVAAFARAAEAAGFDAVGFTDHPAPSHKWLQAGGHDALDPFAALAYVAAATERILLIPNIVVLPYRNPFLVAKSVATLDALSGGRFVLATAPGYQRGEYRALGVDFDDRNELFDEAVAVLRGAWTTDDFAFEGRTFTATGQTANPKPASPVPLWIGGNTARARQRVADLGDGWCPFPAPAVLARTAKTAPLETPADLARVLDDLWRRVEDAGRDRSTIDVAFSTHAGGMPGTDGFDADAHREGIAELAAVGVTWHGVSVPGTSLGAALDGLAAYGEAIIGAGATDT